MQANWVSKCAYSLGKIDERYSWLIPSVAQSHLEANLQSVDDCTAVDQCNVCVAAEYI